ncbi:hypothetical protein BGX26_000395, partial [Mortierella sp. AD094]
LDSMKSYSLVIALVALLVALMQTTASPITKAIYPRLISSVPDNTTKPIASGSLDARSMIYFVLNDFNYVSSLDSEGKYLETVNMWTYFEDKGYQIPLYSSTYGRLKKRCAKNNEYCFQSAQPTCYQTLDFFFYLYYNGKKHYYSMGPVMYCGGSIVQSVTAKDVRFPFDK